MKWVREIFKQLWITVVVAVVLLALYTSAGRQVVPLLETWQPEIEAWLTTQLGQDVRMESLRGDWVGLSPILHIKGLSIGGPGGITVREVRAELDTLYSAIDQLPVFSQIDIHGVRSHGVQVGPRSWQLAADWTITIPEPEETQTTERPLWVTLLEAQKSIHLSDWQVSSTDLNGQPDDVLLRKVHWRSKKDKRALRADLAWGREQLANIRLNAELEGNLWPWKSQNGEVYLEVDEQEWTRWIPDDLPSDIAISTLRAGINGWLNIENGDLENVLINATVPNFAMSIEGEALNFTNGTVTIAGQQRGAADWHLRIRPEFDEELPFTSLSISKVFLDEGASWQMGFPVVDLAGLRSLLNRYDLLPPNIAHYIDGTAAEGTVSDVRISFLPKSQYEAAQFDVRAQIELLKSAAYRGIPAFGHVNADLHIQPQGGVVHLLDDKMEMFVSDFYAQPWALQDASGRFRWHMYGDYSVLLLEDFKASLNNDVISPDLAPTPLSAWLKIGIPRNPNVEGSLGLLLDIPQVPLSVRQQLIPNVVGPEVTDWLDGALQTGMATDVKLALQTRMGGAAPNANTTQLALNFTDVNLQYLDDWPLVENMSGRLWLDTPQLDIWLNEGTTLGGVLLPKSGVAQLRPAKNGTQLTLRAQMKGQSSDALRYFSDTPLRETMGNTFAEWRLDGDYSARLSLSMLLGVKNNPPDITINALLNNNQLYLNDIKLALNNVNGDLTYNTRKGLSSNTLQADVLGGVFQGKIRSDVKPNAMTIRLSGNGSAQWQNFKEWQPLFLFDPITGSLKYNANLIVDNSKVAFELSSNLKGTGIKLPYPMGKTSNTTHPFTARIEAGSPLRIKVNYDQLLNTDLALTDGGIERGQIVLGNGVATLPEQSGIEVLGEWTQTIQAKDWWETWLYMQKLVEAERIPEPLALIEDDVDEIADELTDNEAEALETVQEIAEVVAKNPVERIDVRIGQIMVWDMPMGKTHIKAQQQPDTWDVNIDSALMRGLVKISKDDLPLHAQLDYVHFPLSDDSDAVVSIAKEGTGSVEISDSLAGLNPADFPAVDMNLKELFVGSRHYGAWTFTSKPEPDGLVVHLTDTNVYSLNMKGNVYWYLRDGKHSTRVQKMQMSSRNVGNIQRGFRLVPFIEGKNLDATVNLMWDGSPVAFNGRTLEGNADVRIRNGLVVAEGAGALKALGALNINSMVRRLRLDFSDFNQGGISFDTLTAVFKIHDQVLTLTEPLVVDGPSGKFLTSGYTNLSTHELNLKLAITVPVTGTLPLVAVLAGFAPPVAASIYVTERLIGDELARFTSASYDIGGTWQEPEMKMNRAFDDNIEGKKSRSFKQRFLSIFGISS